MVLANLAGRRGDAGHRACFSARIYDKWCWPNSQEDAETLVTVLVSPRVFMTNGEDRFLGF